jgi:flagellar basal body-associated protein FliL
MNTPTNPPTLRPNNRKKKVFITLAITAILIVTAGAGIYWWHNRPITPTVLNASEQTALDQKIATIQKPPQSTYQPGVKTITLNEREVNALFHNNTGLGDKVKFEFANDAIHARIRTKLDPELPIVGGHTLVAKARFLLKDSNNNNNRAAIILDDITVWGISLPNAWLGDIKGRNLLSDIGLDAPENQISNGIKNIKIQQGKILIELAD